MVPSSTGLDYQINLVVNNARSNVALGLAPKPYVANVGTFMSAPIPINAMAPTGHGGTILSDTMSGGASGIVIYTFPYDPSTILVFGASLDAQSMFSESKVAFLPSETTIDEHTAETFMNDPRFFDYAKKQFKAHANPSGTGPFYLTVTSETRGDPPIVSAHFTIVKTE